VAARQWLATCLYQQGEPAEACELFLTTLDYARAHGYTQGIIDIQTKLATIYLDQQADQLAEQALAESDALAHQYRDRACIAQVKRLYARLHTLRGELAEAEEALGEALDLFERLGMRRELAEVYQVREGLVEVAAGA
jgi:tetratricopeptide (TPR) repeat protein